MATKNETDKKKSNSKVINEIPTLSNLISNLGILCVNTSTFLWRVLSQFGITPEMRAEVFAPVEVFRALQEIFNPSDGNPSTREYYLNTFEEILSGGKLGLYASNDLHGLREAKVIADAINEANPSFEWSKFFDNVESDLNPKSEKYAAKIFGTFLKTAFEENLSRFPTNRLYKKWKNRAFQFYTIKTVIDEAPELIIDTSLNQRLVMQPKIMSSIPLHVANSLRKSPFNSLDLIECLLLFQQDSLYSETKELMEQGIKQRPELILLGLTESKVPWNALYCELIPGLVLHFIIGHPSSSYVLPTLWQSNKALVITGLMHLYSKSPVENTPRIMEVIQELKALPELLNMRSSPFNINLAIFASSKDNFNFEKWLVTHFYNEGQDMLINVINFLHENLLPIDSKSDTTPDTVVNSTYYDPQTLTVSSSKLDNNIKHYNALPNQQHLPTHTIFEIISLLVKNHSSMSPETEASFKTLNHKLISIHPQFTSLVGLLLPDKIPETEVVISNKPDSESELSNSFTTYFDKMIKKGPLSLQETATLLKNLLCTQNRNNKAYCEYLIKYFLDGYKNLEKYSTNELVRFSVIYGCLVRTNFLAPVVKNIVLRNMLRALKHPTDSPQFKFGISSWLIIGEKLPEWYNIGLGQLRRVENIAEFISKLLEQFENAGFSNRKKIQFESNNGEDNSELPFKNTQSLSSPVIDVETDICAKNIIDKMESSSSHQNSNDTNTLPPKPSTPDRNDDHSEPARIAETSEIPRDYRAPSETVQDYVLFIINNLSATNIDEKAQQMHKYLDEQTRPWLGHYMISKRVCFEPNFSELYVEFLDKIKDKKLDECVIESTYKVIYDIIGVKKTEYTMQERRSLKNLGTWLGQITLVKNKPIKYTDMSFKDLLTLSYENKSLSAIVPFVCKTLEQTNQNSVFALPNPWTMSVLKMLVELYYYSQMKTNLKLQIEILCKNLNVKINDIEPVNLFRSLQCNTDPEISAPSTHNKLPEQHSHPCRDEKSFQSVSQGFNDVEQSQAPNVTFNSNRDYNPTSQNIRKVQNATSASPSTEKQWPNNYGMAATSRSATQYGVRSADYPYFLKRIIQMGVENAIREVITAVVERSVTIGEIATRELVNKDFNLDNFDDRLTKAAHMMSSALAGSLAAVSSREPLRVSIIYHIKVLLSLSGCTDTVSDQVLHQMVSDCLDYACSVMETAASERAAYEADETSMSIITKRKQQRQANSKNGSAVKPELYPHSINLPPMLRLKSEGITSLQWKAYEDFTCLERSAGSHVQDSTGQDSSKKRDAPSYQPSAPLSNSQQIYVHVFEEFMKLAYDLEKQIVEHSKVPMEKGSVPEEIANLFLNIQYLVLFSHRVDVCIFFTQKIVQLLYKHYHFQLAQEVFVSLLSLFCRVSIKCASELNEWFLYRNDDRKYNPVVVSCLLMAYLINPVELDAQMSRMILCGNQTVINFSIELLQLFLSRYPLNSIYNAFTQTFDTFYKLHIQNKAPSMFEKILEINSEKTFTLLLKKPIIKDENSNIEIHTGMSQIFMNWISVYFHPYSNEESHEMFIECLYSNIPPSDINIMNLFTTCVHLCIDSNRFSKISPTKFSYLCNYQIADAFSKLICLLIAYEYKKRCKIFHPHQYNMSLMINVLISILIAVSLVHKVEGTSFKQRPILWIFSSFFNDMASILKNLPIYTPLLLTTCDMLSFLRPSLFPAMTYAWIQIISHRNFMPRVLSMKEHWAHFHVHLLELLKFMSTLFEIQGMSETPKYVYKAAIKIISCILNDFPEFLCAYHISLVSSIPHSCIYLRNLILSASPRNVRLPDPFTPNLKIDLLPEMSQLPQILSDYVSELSRMGILEELDTYLDTRNPLIFLTKLKSSLMYQTPNGKIKYNIPAINSLVLYVGTKAVSRMQKIAPQNSIPFIHNPTLDIYQQLITDLDAEGRYYLFSALADQLRYPNRHTHYFSCVILYLFAEATQELIAEQITRVLVERAVVGKPHPYGLLITYVELIRNKRYKFWENKSYLTCSPDIEGMFLAVRKLINQLLVRAT